MKKGLIGGNGLVSSKSLFPNPRPLQGVGNSTTVGGSVSGNVGQRVPSKSLSQAELEDRRRKGLCFWCGLKYSPGHKCFKSQVFQLFIDPNWEQGSDVKSLNSEEIQDYSDHLELVDQVPNSPVLSLHALQGLQGHTTMRFSAIIDHTEVVVLVDSVPWAAQGYHFQTDFLLLSVKGFDLVLGIQWLLTLGPITWDFANLTMQFQHQKQNCLLRGLVPGSLQLVPSTQFSKCLSLVGNGPYPMLLTSREQTAITLQPAQVADELQSLLGEFEDIFQTPVGLPPPHLQDHKIPLTDETKVVKVKPYRYPAVQKIEIGKLVQEMLQAGIIRDSNSPFASPVVIVKKKDGSWRLCIDYRQLNQLTIKDRFPIPVIEELLDELGQANFFLSWICVQAIIKFEYVHKTAFKTHEGHYEFLVMPFGLTNAPSSFQSLMNSIFRPFLKKSVLVFFMTSSSTRKAG
ncbi:reverse transcriptase [Gossypium australe]|uniref:Reverse transcriptase n=1 Tax=Gossypium australe TaxID=47621 RepID=A0A5B6UYN5_9ROSI|nr:reverse transcriptase [Gossypium australe]